MRRAHRLRWWLFSSGPAARTELRRRREGIERRCRVGSSGVAFEHQGFERLVSLIYRDNAASIRVAEKIGMAPEKEVELRGKRVLLYSLQHG